MDKLASFPRNLGRLGLTPAESEAVRNAVSGQRRVAARQAILEAGDDPADVLVLLEGLAAGHKLLADGGRQIVSFAVAGDLCNAQSLVTPVLDYGITALTDTVLAVLPKREMARVVDEHPAVARALWAATAAEAAIQREWVLNLGQRPAASRLAHLLCEMGARLSAAGVGSAGRFTFPVTQSDLGDALGLSTVHVNRSLQELRRLGLITFRTHVVEVHRPEALQELATFDPAYLAVAPRIAATESRRALVGA